MSQVLKIESVQQKNGRSYTVLEVPSESNPNKFYRADIVGKRCSCPAWIFSKKRAADNSRATCKHLRRLGYSDAV